MRSSVRRRIRSSVRRGIRSSVVSNFAVSLLSIHHFVYKSLEWYDIYSLLCRWVCAKKKSTQYVCDGSHITVKSTNSYSRDVWAFVVLFFLNSSFVCICCWLCVPTVPFLWSSSVYIIKHSYTFEYLWQHIYQILNQVWRLKNNSKHYTYTSFSSSVQR